jgi:putative PIN family toxin of toxin-antitoxin system
MLKVVLDTNVLVSGVIASGYSASILDAARRQEIILITSAHLLAEFSDVITRHHIVRKYPLAATKAEDLLDFLRAFSILAPGIPSAKKISSDRDDDFVLACATDEHADAIVSGDPHLLNVKNYQHIPIITPKEFVVQFLKQK